MALNGVPDRLLLTADGRLWATSIGVILLIAELTQNREMMRAWIRHELSMGIVELLSDAANNNQFAKVAIRGRDLEELAPDEQLQLDWFLNALLRYWEEVHYQYGQGLYDVIEYSKQKDSWEATLRGSNYPGTYWCRVRLLYSSEFMTELDSLLTTRECEQP